MNIGPIIFTLLFLLNVAAFGLYAWDKHRATYDQWRLPEALLLGIALLGGAYGAGSGMLLFRHKTLHKAFLIVVPLSFVLWTMVLLTLCYYHNAVAV